MSLTTENLLDLAPADRRDDLALALKLGWKIEQNHSGGWAIIEPNGYRHAYYSPFSSLLEDYLPKFYSNLSDAVRLWPGAWEMTRHPDASITVRLQYIDMVVCTAVGYASASIATVFCRAVLGALDTHFPLLRYVVSDQG